MVTALRDLVLTSSINTLDGLDLSVELVFSMFSESIKTWLNSPDCDKCEKKIQLPQQILHGILI